MSHSRRRSRPRMSLPSATAVVAVAAVEAAVAVVEAATAAASPTRVPAARTLAAPYPACAA